MTNDISNAMAQAREAAEGTSADRFVERLATLVGAQAGAAAVFGEPIDRGELTVVPVARARWGFGGGAGSGPNPAGAESGAGSGGGGGVGVDPIGYIEIRPTGATFQPIIPPYPSPLFVLAAGLTAALVLRSLARLIRR